jgi:hypothetical protein
MALLQLALIVLARRELTLSAGEVSADGRDEPGLRVESERVETVEGPAFLKVGLSTTGSVNVTGAEVVNAEYPGDSLKIGWYLPSEEGPEMARPVELDKVGVVPSELARDPARPGHVWRFRVDGRGPFVEKLFYNSGYQPPFRPTDVTLHLTDIKNYGFATYVLSKVVYGHKAPSYTEGFLRLSETIAQGTLEE